MNSILTRAFAATACMAALALPTFAQDQADLIKPIDKELTFVFIPKVIHPWYDVVAQGATFAAAEFEKQGIKINVIWDQPPQADVVDQNQRIEANIGRHPDGLAIACLDRATNVQLMNEAVAAGINVVNFNSFCDDAFPFIGPKSSVQDGYDLGERLAEILGGKGKVAILSGSLTASDHVERITGFKDAPPGLTGARPMQKGRATCTMSTIPSTRGQGFPTCQRPSSSLSRSPARRRPRPASSSSTNRPRPSPGVRKKP